MELEAASDDLSKALVHAGKAKEIMTALVKKDPANALWRQDFENITNYQAKLERNLDA